MDIPKITFEKNSNPQVEIKKTPHSQEEELHSTNSFSLAVIYQENLKDDLKSLHHPINDGRHVSQGQDGH